MRKRSQPEESVISQRIQPTHCTRLNQPTIMFISWRRTSRNRCYKRANWINFWALKFHKVV